MTTMALYHTPAEHAERHKAIVAKLVTQTEQMSSEVMDRGRRLMSHIDSLQREISTLTSTLKEERKYTYLGERGKALNHIESASSTLLTLFPSWNPSIWEDC